MLRPRSPGKGAGQVAQAVERMHRAELVDVRHHGAHATRQRLEAFKPQERVQPHDALGLAPQPLHFMFQRLDALAVEPVGHDQHLCSLRQHAAGPVIIEVLQRRADACAAGPVLHGRRYLRHRLVDVAALQFARHVGEAGPEQEDMHPVAVIGQRMEEVQEHARVVGARARDIAQHDERRFVPLLLAPLEVDEVAACPHRSLQRAAHVDGRAPARALPPPCHDLGAVHAQPCDGLPGLRLLGHRHLLEVLLAQHLV